VDPLGEVDSSVVRSIFDEFDTNRSGTIEGKELQGLLLGLQLGGTQGKVDKETMDYWVKVRGEGLGGEGLGFKGVDKETEKSR
jgi:hypothetical protein